MPSPPLSSFQARPGQTLERHLTGVAAAASALASDGGATPYGDDWSMVLQTVAWTHDLGKLTSYFQQYLETGDRSDAPYPELTYHGEVSAFVTLQALAAQGCSPQTTAAGFYAVAKHHSILPNLRADLHKYTERKPAADERLETAKRQLTDIDETAAAAADALLQEATGGALRWDEVWTTNVEGYRKTLRNLDSAVDDAAFYGCVLRLWSTLVTSDKFDAGGLTTPEDADELRTTSRPSLRKLTAHVRALSSTPLSDGGTAVDYLDNPSRALPSSECGVDERLAALRAAANGRATRTLLSEAEAGGQVFELTLPTGFGKTLTGLRAALSLAEERNSRVVYALPYTSIIDQVDTEVRQIFPVDLTSEAYTKHHHLADTRTNPEELRHGDHVSTGRDTLHAEAWRSGLVLTTFTQLFESLAGPGNVQSVKLPALEESVIIVDEPQAVSLDWWALIGRLTAYLTAEYDATVIFMTATQPRILEQLSDAPTPTPLVDLQEACTDLISSNPRVEFAIDTSLAGHLDGERTPPLCLESAADKIRRASTGDRDTLAIVNTVESAATLTDQLTTASSVALGSRLIAYQRQRSGDQFNPERYLKELAEQNPDASTLTAVLTTRLRPADRSAILSALRRILDPEVSTPFDDVPTITVSTQLIEAGVDVSFDRLYRDFAPLPSLVQAAGRCNRSFDGTTGTVTVWRLDSSDTKEYVPSELIYGERSLLRPTRIVLNHLRSETGDETVSEAALITRGTERYYDELHDQRRTGDRHDQLVAAFDEGHGDTLRNASLIEQDYPTRDILVLLTSADQDLYERYRQQRSDKRWRAARKTFQQLKQYLVSIPVDTASESDEIEVIGPNDIDTAYALTSGRGPQVEGLVSDTEV